MLNENDVIDAVIAFLESDGHQIISRCTTRQQGIDIVAEHPVHPGKLRIEAKGGTSSKEGSARYDLGFNGSQVFDRLAKGFYTAAKLHCEHRQEGDRAGLAYPDTPPFRNGLTSIMPILKQLDIAVYLVDADRRVSLLFEPDTVAHDRWFAEKVAVGFAQLDRGEGIPHEEVGQRIKRLGL